MEFEDFISRLGSGSPTPGGGAASAIVGSIAASLTMMVANLTLNRKGYESVQGRMKEMVEECTSMVREFMDLAKEDENAFTMISEAWKLPKSTEEEKAERRRKIAGATEIALKPPFKIAARAIRVMELSIFAYSNGNRNARSDASCSAEFAYSTFKGAISNVMANIPSLRPEVREDELIKVKLLDEYASKLYRRYLASSKFYAAEFGSVG